MSNCPKCGADLQPELVGQWVMEHKADGVDCLRNQLTTANVKLDREVYELIQREKHIEGDR
jgi:hypothetical protein